MPKTVVEVFKTEPWLKTPDENGLEYEMFQFFRDTMPMERPTLLPTICAKFGKEDWEIKDIATRNHWLWRCNQYDVYLEAARTQGAIRGKFEAGKSMIALSKRLMKKSEDAFDLLETNKIMPSHRDAIEMARLAIELNKSGLALEGISSGKESMDIDPEDSPSTIIESATAILLMAKKQTRHIKKEEIVDGELLEAEDLES